MLGASSFSAKEVNIKKKVEIETKNDDNVVTLKEFLETQRKLELQAAEALPFRFDKCSAELGPLRQNLHICHGCPFSKDVNRPLAFCYACAITCHNFEPCTNESQEEKEKDCSNENVDDVFGAYSDEKSSKKDSENEIEKTTSKNNTPEKGIKSNHEIEEIWSRRNFICDCPSTNHCKLLKSQSIPSVYTKHSNSRHSLHNFKGLYCLCKSFGWVSGDRTMYQCEICEDWFHDTCVARDHLKGATTEIEIPDEDSFIDFICKACVETNSSFFSNLILNDHIFTVPPQNSLTNKKLGPLFLAEGWRPSLRSHAVDLRILADELKISHLLLEEEEPVYEPEIDTDATESLYDLGLKALQQNTPRDQAILGIKLIDSLKDRLKNYLDSLVTSDPSHTITSEDIRSFFSNEEIDLQHKRSRINY